MAKVCPLFSGSSGNSYYIGTGEHGILVDAGRTAKQMEGALSANDINISSVRAIFVTHEHTDHVKGLRVLASRHHIKVYSSMGTLEALNDMQILSGKFPCDVISENGIQEAGMEIRPFHTSHDSAESVGYRISLPNGRVVVVATDLGFVSEEVRSALAGCDVAVMESNHDVGMLQSGGYPYYLKRRILSPQGHLSNSACAQSQWALPRSWSAPATAAACRYASSIPTGRSAVARASTCSRVSARCWCRVTHPFPRAPASWELVTLSGVVTSRKLSTSMWSWTVCFSVGSKPCSML